MSYADDTIEFVLMHVPTIESAVNEARLNDTGAGHTGGGGSGHSRVSDPTALKAIRSLLDIPAVDIPFGPLISGQRETRRIKRPEKWLKVAAAVSSYYLNSERMADFYNDRYIILNDWKTTCREQQVTRGAYYAMRADVLHHAELYAVQYGLLAPCVHGLKVL